MSRVRRPTARPATTPAEARLRFAELARRDGPEISAAGRSRLIAPDGPASGAVVLIHGFTNCPEQWMPFATRFGRPDEAIVIPRLPGHGFADLDSRAIGRVQTDELLATVSDAVDIAAGYSSRVVLCGLSIGGSIAVELALDRGDVTTAVAIVPFFGIKALNAGANALAAWALRTLPNVFVPWDPTGKDASIPPYAYARFPTRVLGECVNIGIDCYDRALEGAPRGFVHMLLNANEPACNNEISLEIARRFVADRPGSTQTIVLDDLPANHDIIDIHNPQERVATVYPEVRSLIDR